MVARSVCWRGSESRPPLSRSSRWERRSRIWRERAPSSLQRQARRRGEGCPACTKLGDLLAWLDVRSLAEEGDGFGLGERWDRVLDLAGDAQELAARDEKREVGAALRRDESSGAASMTCSRLSSRRSISRSAMCSARPSLAPSVWAIVSVTRAGSRREQAQPRTRLPCTRARGTSLPRARAASCRCPQDR